MKLVRTSTTQAIPLQPEWFDGEGTRQDVTRVDAPSAAATVVRFEPGARTHWHSHRDGQFIYVLDGKGRTATRRDAEMPMEEGDLVYVAPGEEHWHGATEHTAVRHLALSFGETSWLEPVE